MDDFTDSDEEVSSMTTSMTSLTDGHGRRIRSVSVYILYLLCCLDFQDLVLNPLPNDKFWTPPNSKKFQTKFSNLLKIAEGSLNR